MNPQQYILPEPESVEPTDPSEPDRLDPLKLQAMLEAQGFETRFEGDYLHVRNGRWWNAFTHAEPNPPFPVEVFAYEQNTHEEVVAAWVSEREERWSCRNVSINDIREAVRHELFMAGLIGAKPVSPENVHGPLDRAQSHEILAHERDCIVIRDRDSEAVHLYAWVNGRWVHKKTVASMFDLLS